MRPFKRAKTLLSGLAALCALAGLAALAPVPAGAVDDNGGIGACLPRTGELSQMDWSNIEFCAVDPLSGGGGGSGGSHGAVELPEETIEVEGVIPKPPPPPSRDEVVTYCLKNPSRCQPRQIGGGGGLFAGRDGGPKAGEPAGRGGSGAPGKKRGEVAKAGPKKPSKAECEKAESSWGVSVLPGLEPTYQQLKKREMALSQKLDAPFKAFWERYDRVVSLMREVETLERSRSRKIDATRALWSEAEALKKKMTESQDETGQIFQEINEVKAEMEALQAQSDDAWKQLIDRCGKSSQAKA